MSPQALNTRKGRWVNVPGKGERWQMPDGSYRHSNPATGQMSWSSVGQGLRDFLLGDSSQQNRAAAAQQAEAQRRFSPASSNSSSSRPRGTQAILNGKPVFWTGDKYGWQSAESSVKNGLLGSEVVGQPGSAPATPGRAKGTQAILNGKPVFWTGDKYGWQSAESSVKHGLLGSEVVGQPGSAPAAPVLPPPETFGGAGTTAPIQTTETGGAPTFATSPAPTVSAQQTQQFQQAAGVAKAYQDQVAALENKFGGAPELESVANMTSLPAGGISIPGVDKQTDVTLPQYYAAQQAVGAQRFNAKNSELDSVISQLGYDEKMKQWAMANPALAQREYARMLQRNAQTGAPASAPAPAENKVISGQSLPGNVIDYPVG